MELFGFDSVVTRLAIVDIDGTIRHTLDIQTSGRHVREFVTTCLASLETARTHHHSPRLRSIGITVAGFIEPVHSKVEFAPLFGWEDLDVGTLLHEIYPEVGIVAIENDAKASAVAALWLGRHVSRVRTFVFLSVSQGMGAGIVIDNLVLKGEAHLAGEFRHATLVQEGEPC